ncbi:TPA: hypothetical protein ACSY8X_14810 [Listeria monocytogenes]|nr:hypothetical protein [Listeria monocytogenes]EGK1647110.1 DUF4062 domain-containing protein [Listeria monocytogenes]EHL5772192.1 hypothetical protein [Listeria monocytogenes]EIM1204868.1 hypothetical protein [Listeria monocytogenes]
MKSIDQYSILLSFPSDVTEELKVIETVFERFNNFANGMGIGIKSKHWRKDIYPAAGQRPQSTINEQIVDESDAIICIFWTRFGTPTGDYGSGTEEEMERLLNSGKQVFLYFSHIGVNPREIDSEQMEKVEAFEKKHQEDTLYKSYDTIDKFEEILTSDLNLYFLDKLNPGQSKEQKKSSLTIKSFSSNGESSKREIEPVLPDTISKELELRELKQDFLEIKDISIFKVEIIKPIHPSLKAMANYNRGEEVTFSQEKRKLIEIFAQKLDIEIDDDFFLLNSLHYEVQFISLHGAPPRIIGEEDSKKKYYLLEGLYRKIYTYLNYQQYSDQFKKYRKLTLFISNEGEQYDEDIDVTIIAPKGSIKTLNEFTPPEDYILDYFSEDFLEQLFYNQKTAEIMDYGYHKINRTDRLGRYEMTVLRTENMYNQAIEALDVIEKYEAGLDDKFQLNFPYLKQNTSIFFPVPIFLPEDEVNNIEITYEIRSKFSSSIIKGDL